MPERPDLEYVVPRLRTELVGARIDGFSLRKPVVLRVVIDGDPEELCRGCVFAGVERRGHFVRFLLQGPRALEIVISPMLVGVFDLVNAGARIQADVATIWDLADGRQLRYRDNKQMGKVYMIAPGDEGAVPRLASQTGLDVLDPRIFDRAVFRRLARSRRDQVRVFLMDKSALDSLGNAYADEVLWHAMVHPKAWTRQLDDEQLDRLHDALVEVIGSAVETIRTRQPPLAKKLRDFLKVRGRAGQPCPRCETRLRRARVRSADAHFCPRCQPDDRGAGIVDWRKLDG